MSEFTEEHLDGMIARALRAPKPGVVLAGLWRQVGVSIGDGDVKDPVAMCRRLAVAELKYHQQGDVGKAT